MIFQSIRASQIVAYELGTSISDIEKDCVSMVAMSLGLFTLDDSEIYPNNNNSIINIGCVPSRLQRIFLTLDDDDNDIDSRVINVDRFYIQHPSHCFYQTLSFSMNQSQLQCINCKRIMKDLLFKICPRCFGLYVKRFQCSNPSDFGSFDHWLKDHQSVIMNEAATSCSLSTGSHRSHSIFDNTDEWFLSWNDFKHIFMKSLSSHIETMKINKSSQKVDVKQEDFHTLEVIESILIPGNGRSYIPFEIVKLERFAHIVVSDAIPEICYDMSNYCMKSICKATNEIDDDRNKRTIESPSSSSSFYLMNSNLCFVQDDITHSRFNDNQFDMILDKGLLDALACSLTIGGGGVGGRNRSCDNDDRTTTDLMSSPLKLAVEEYHRLLKPNGLLIVISGRDRSYVLKYFSLHKSLFDNVDDEMDNVDKQRERKQQKPPYSSDHWSLISETHFACNLGDINQQDSQESNISKCGYYTLRRS